MRPRPITPPPPSKVINIQSDQVRVGSASAVPYATATSDSNVEITCWHDEQQVRERIPQISWQRNVRSEAGLHPIAFGFNEATKPAISFEEMAAARERRGFQFAASASAVPNHGISSSRALYVTHAPQAEDDYFHDIFGERAATEEVSM